MCQSRGPVTDRGSPGIPSPRGGPHASRKRFPLSAPRTAPAGREHALLARGLPLIIIIIIALAALVLSSVGHAQDVGPGTCIEYRADGGVRPGDGHWPSDLCAVVHHRRPSRRLLPVVGGRRPQSRRAEVTAEVALWRSHSGGIFEPHWLSLLPDSQIDDAFGSGHHRRRRLDAGAVQRERCAALTRYDLLDRGDQDRGRR